MQKYLYLLLTLFFTIDIYAAPITVNLNYTRRGFIARAEGTRDSYFNSSLKPSNAYNGGTFGYGHGNRCHVLVYYDLTNIMNLRAPNQLFVVTSAYFGMYTAENLNYTGGSTINPIQVDWVSGAVYANWYNIEGSGTGVAGRGSTVATGKSYGHWHKTYAGSDPNQAFNQMIAAWLNGDSPNYGFLYRASSGSRSSFDGYATVQFSFTYELILNPNIPEPSSFILIALSLAALLLYKR